MIVVDFQNWNDCGLFSAACDFHIPGLPLGRTELQQLEFKLEASSINGGGTVLHKLHSRSRKC